MQYDSEQLSKELAALEQSKACAHEHYIKICGAIDMVAAMQKCAIEQEKKAKEEADAQAKAIAEATEQPHDPVSEEILP